MAPASMKQLKQTSALLVRAFQGLGPENKKAGEEIQALKKLVQDQKESFPDRRPWALGRC